VNQVLILGASYGSLFATKLLLAGHRVRLVCLPDVAELIANEGTRVRVPVQGRDELLELDSRDLPGQLSASVPSAVDPTGYDLAVLAMQEPQYRSDDVRALLTRVAAARVPCLSIMNMPPLPFLARIPGIAVDALRDCYTDASVWDPIDPVLLTHCSADPQASRVPDAPQNVIQVRLPTNFKAAQFERREQSSVLLGLAASVEAARLDTGSTRVNVPVKLKVHDSVFVPLAKWPMLITGNYRCIGRDDVRSIEAAVHADLEASRRIYQWVLGLCRSVGATVQDAVPFERYAAAATALKAPASVARAIAAGATRIERVDRLVQAIAAQHGARLAELDEIVATVDGRLARA